MQVPRECDMRLQVLLVDDEPADLQTFVRDFPVVFEEAGISVDIHPVGSFDEAFKLSLDPSRRFDLILSDTYAGKQSMHDAAVIELVNSYRGVRFCPIVVFSASSKPEGLELGDFVVWSDKSKAGEIENAIRDMLETGVPQAARGLHDDLDQLAGNYLWSFLDKNWDELKQGGHVEPEALGRMIRRRAALQLAELTYTETGSEPLKEVHGIEFYAYPPLNSSQYSLGEIIQNKTEPSDIRVILTPHCYLTIQKDQTKPRATFVKTIKAVPAGTLLSQEKRTNTKANELETRHKKLRSFVTPPSKIEIGSPAGRYWYLPALLEIPHLYCDFMQVNSVVYRELGENYKSLAVLSPPYSESLQACYVAFHAAVGIPNIAPASAEGLLE